MSLEGTEEKIEKLRKETNEVKKKSPSLMSFAVEVDQFYKEWDVMSRRLGNYDVYCMKIICMLLD